MRPYEVMIILDAGLEEEAIRTTVDQATKLIVRGGGTPGRVDRWGKRRFAYEINHKSDGYYVVIEATAEPPAMADLDRMLHLADEVIRYKVVRLPDKVAGRATASVAATSAPAPEPNVNGA
jgi:small subunit ribosomal protein S6